MHTIAKYSLVKMIVKISGLLKTPHQYMYLPSFTQEKMTGKQLCYEYKGFLY